jgi:ubiquinone/menaquinone biosynthesis C-methylase UbiE
MDIGSFGRKHEKDRGKKKHENKWILAALGENTRKIGERKDMKKNGYYTSGQFMKLAHITKKTIRYYDEHDILKPSFVDEDTRARYYTDADFARLQQILLLKYLGFSLADIREMTINAADSHFMTESLQLQQKLVQDRIDQLQVVAQTLRETTELVEKKQVVDWRHMLDLIYQMSMETSMKNQYQNASNISARIQLHRLYSQNKKGWFPWAYEQCGLKSGMQVLEVGCGDGSFWKNNRERLPEKMQVILSDVSEGMLRDARRETASERDQFSYAVFSCEKIPCEDESFDVVIANHVLFYCKDIRRACEELHRVLKKGGKLICSTYGMKHMQEITNLVKSFDDRIILSADNLFDRFGKENGKGILTSFFSKVTWKGYEDSLFVTEPEPLVSYVLSCHGNQNQYILDHYKEFRQFVKKQVNDGFYITKDAGIFIAEK